MEGKSGIKVTYIETQFVTSDKASFKSLVQSLTGKSAGAGPGLRPANPLHRPRPCRAGAEGRSSVDAGSQGCYGPLSAGSAGDGMLAAVAGAAGRTAPPCVEKLHGVHDFSELFYVVGAGEWRNGGSYSDFLY